MRYLPHQCCHAAFVLQVYQVTDPSWLNITESFSHSILEQHTAVDSQQLWQSRQTLRLYMLSKKSNMPEF